ncbi:MAG: hypothetical protein ABEJ96_09340 [Thiohalorhabdaceae bacterium]
MTSPAEVLAANLEAAYRVGQRLIQARDRLADVWPLDESRSPEALDDDTVVWIDAFLKRWENFQDMLDGQLVRGVVLLEGEAERVVTRRDRARLLEKLAIVDSAEAWFDAGQLRNQLVHGYPLSDPKQVHRINAAFGHTDLLIATFDRIRSHVGNRALAAVPVPALQSSS